MVLTPNGLGHRSATRPSTSILDLGVHRGKGLGLRVLGFEVSYKFHEQFLTLLFIQDNSYRGPSEIELARVTVVKGSLLIT